MDRALIKTIMDLSIKDPEFKANNTEKVNNGVVMEATIKVNLLLDRKMERGKLSFGMELGIRGCFKRTSFMDMACLFGLMEESIKVSLK